MSFDVEIVQLTEENIDKLVKAGFYNKSYLTNKLNRARANNQIVFLHIDRANYERMMRDGAAQNDASDRRSADRGTDSA